MFTRYYPSTTFAEDKCSNGHCFDPSVYTYNMGDYGWFYYSFSEYWQRSSNQHIFTDLVRLVLALQSSQAVANVANIFGDAKSMFSVMKTAIYVGVTAVSDTFMVRHNIYSISTFDVCYLSGLSLLYCLEQGLPSDHTSRSIVSCRYRSVCVIIDTQEKADIIWYGRGRRCCDHNPFRAAIGAALLYPATI